MSDGSRLSAVLAYVPVIGWLYVYLVQRRDALAVYHLRQSIGLCIFLVGVLLAWVVAAWLLAWIPYLGTLSIGMFTVVMAAWLFGAFALVAGVIRAARSRQEPLPIFGRWASRLPIA